MGFFAWMIITGKVEKMYLLIIIMIMMSFFSTHNKWKNINYHSRVIISLYINALIYSAGKADSLFLFCRLIIIIKKNSMFIWLIIFLLFLLKYLFFRTLVVVVGSLNNWINRQTKYILQCLEMIKYKQKTITESYWNNNKQRQF